ncbi:MAG: bifunctional diguanylate cyclase/phosphodiesterase [Actinomycetota bacterium]
MAGDERSERGGAADAAASSSDALLIVGDADEVTWANAAAQSLLGTEHLIGADLTRLLEFRPGQGLAALRGATPQRTLGTISRRDDERIPVEVGLAPLQDKADQWVVTILPLPRSQLSVRELLRRANEDRLTTLVNRSYFIESVEATFRDPVTAEFPYALAMLDLDGFKRINDTWGHDAGDTVLIQVADRLRRTCRPGDVVARLGGDEFAIWCRRLGGKDTLPFLERVRSVFDEPVQVGDIALPIAGSIGCTTTRVPRDSLELLREADMAMYNAKGEGVGLIRIFDQQMRDDARRRVSLEQDLRRAMTTDELRFVYQPIVRIREGVVVGVEALVRWEHPGHGTLAPADFFSILDQAALRADLDTVLIPRAIAQVAAWNEERRVPLSVWVNLSPVSLTLPMIDTIEAALADHEVSGEHLVVELGEESSLTGKGQQSAIDRLRSLGVRVALDDFGTGNAQLDVLPHLELDYVKLDRSFVQGISDNATRRTLCRSVIGLAHALGARIVAEGIEDARDLLTVTDLGADLVQGFHLARPAPVGSILGVDDTSATIDLRDGHHPLADLQDGSLGAS